MAPNERKLSNLLTLSILLEATISPMRYSTLPYENENHVSLEYVKKSKTDFDFFPDYIFTGYKFFAIHHAQMNVIETRSTMS